MKTTIVFAFLAFLSSACASASTSGGVTSAQAVAEVAASTCQKLAECFPSNFAAAYPMGESQCEARGEASLAPENQNRQEVCTQAQIDQCIADIKAAPCSATASDYKAPPSCEGC